METFCYPLSLSNILTLIGSVRAIGRAEEFTREFNVFLLLGYGLGVVISVVDKLLQVWFPKHVLLLLLLGKALKLDLTVSNNLNLEFLFLPYVDLFVIGDLLLCGMTFFIAYGWNEDRTICLSFYSDFSRLSIIEFWVLDKDFCYFI